MNEQKKLTLKDLARTLGVSTATISNAYNRPDQLSASLREHILQQCEAMGYFGPNATARSLRTGKTNIIGVMLSNYLAYSFSDAVANQFLQGLAEVFEQREYNLLIMPSREHLKQVQGVESFVEGFIVYGPPQTHKLKQLQQQKKSMVAVDFTVPGSPSINIDNYAAAKEIATHALRHLETKAGVLALRVVDANCICPIQQNALLGEGDIITVPRLHGFIAAAKQRGLAIADDCMINVPDNTHALAYAAAHQLLTQASGINVLLCMSDRLALAAIAAARDLGLRVPQDVRITGFDGIPEAVNHPPSLTTVHQQSIDKGRIAAEIFLGLRKPAQIMLPTRLVVRDSCP